MFHRKPRRGRHRVKRTRRLTLRHVAAVTPAIVAIAVVFVPPTANGDTHQTRAVGQAHADYHDLGRWPVDHPHLCIEDLTHGFPVETAAAEFAGIVSMDVRADCDAEYVIRIVTINDPGENFTAWFSTQRDDDQHFTAGLIRLNLARSYRMTPDDWRIALVHELGHAAGLEHAKRCADSVMDPSVCKYGNVGGLTDADRQQLDEIYGGAR